MINANTKQYKKLSEQKLDLNSTLVFRASNDYLKKKGKDEFSTPLFNQELLNNKQINLFEERHDSNENSKSII
jgi:hypothetical protein